MRTTLGLLACAAVLIGGCGGSGTGSAGVTRSAPSGVPTAGTAVVVSSTHSPAQSPTDPPAHSASPAKAGVVLTLAASRYGPVLFDGSGQAIYTFDAERTSRPACYGDCASAWPPVLTAGAPVAGGGVRPELLGVTVRSDGSAQATYRGKPLYFYAAEGKHAVLCHNVREFGGLWLAITEDGSPAPS
jgi:predicted lipoprotein with Yx(FWY)xxD motif